MELEPITLWFILISTIITIRGISTPSSFNIRRLFRPRHLHDQEVYNNHGTIVGLYEGFRPTLMIGDPDLVRDILVKDFHNFPKRRAFNFGHLPDRIGLLFMTGWEEKWARLRSLMTPHFSAGRMRLLTPKINECVGNLLQNLSKINIRRPVDIAKFYSAFSLDVIASTAFGINIDSLNQPNNPIVANAKKFFSQQPLTRIMFEFYLTFSRITKLRPSNFESFNYFSRLTDRITREKQYNRKRKLSGSKLNGKNADFIELFLDIVDNRDETFPEDIEEEELVDEDALRSPADLVSIFGHDTQTCLTTDHNANRRKSISLDEIKAQGILFFMAGFAGNAALLSNMSYLLARHPEVQERLIQEIDSSNQEPNFDIINGFKFLDAVVWETLRLFPPVVRVERECVADYKLAKTGITIPAGMTVSIPIYAIHRDPQNFEDPDSFLPERFLSHDSSEPGLRHPWCFLPFGGGPRNCLGMRLAIHEAKMCIVQVLKRYRFHLDPGHLMEHISDQVIVSPKQVFLHLEERKEFAKEKKPIKRKRGLSNASLEMKIPLKRQDTM